MYFQTLIAKKEVLHPITWMPVSTWEVPNAVPAASSTNAALCVSEFKTA